MPSDPVRLSGAKRPLRESREEVTRMARRSEILDRIKAGRIELGLAPSASGDGGQTLPIGSTAWMRGLRGEVVQPGCTFPPGYMNIRFERPPVAGSRRIHFGLRLVDLDR